MTKQLATFAGGCFWCMVKPFDRYDGVEQVLSGYTGGTIPHPTYEMVCTNLTGHREAVQITFDDEKISYEELLAIFWKSIDPTDGTGQFYDRGQSYEPVIYVHSEEQRRQAEASKQTLSDSGIFQKPIVVPIVEARPFYEAEPYHQNYYQTSSSHYERYARGSGRIDFLTRYWGNSDE